MSEIPDQVYAAVERQVAGESAHSRRKFIAGTAATLGGMGLAGLAPAIAQASDNTAENILNVAATAEVLATIVNTVGAERHLGGDPWTQRNIKAAAREELLHYDTLKAVGGKTLTTRIWVPDAVFASRENLLNTLQVGDQIFINAYLIGTVTWGNQGNGALAATAAEFMGVEAVHRALARQSLGQLGNDRVFMKYSEREDAPGAPNRGQAGFTDILGAVSALEAAGFGFGAKGAHPGSFYDFDSVRHRTPRDPDLNTFHPVA